MNKTIYLLLIYLFFLGFQQSKASDKPNFIWINCEDISPNLGCYSDDYATTPNIDALAESGIVYTEAFSAAPICTPSRTSLITGVYATSMGTQHLRSMVERDSRIKTIAELLRDAGYFTSNSAKTDYNFDPTGIWEYWKQDKAPWRQRKNDEPFFSMFVYGMTHEGSTNKPDNWLKNTKDWPEEKFHRDHNVFVPPYFPNNDVFKKIYNRYYDNITVFDETVGDIMENLKNDGLLENTFVFVFSDHGTGLPRYKRWLYNTGIHVPLVVHIPEKYKNLVQVEKGSSVDELVNLVDLSSTVLSIADLPIPSIIEGQAFLGKKKESPRKYIYTTRSRADNMYEMSRSVRDERYIYIKHGFPHVPYLQSGFIFDEKKESFAELHRLYQLGELPEETQKMYKPKGREELYDLEKDPFELNNLVDDPSYRKIKTRLKNELADWQLKTHDSGLFHEAEYMWESRETNPYAWCRQIPDKKIKQLIEVSSNVGDKDEKYWLDLLKDKDPAIRYWAVIGLQAINAKSGKAISALNIAMQDSSPAVAISAASTILNSQNSDKALDVLGKYMLDDRPYVSLYASRCTELAGMKAKQLIPIMYEVLDKNKRKEGEPGNHKHYKNFEFASFTSWSIKYALHICGEDIDYSF